jgi:putative transposase
MSEQTTQRTCRTTYKEKLRPTPAQERALEAVLWRCRVLYNTALEQRITAWQRCRVCLTRYQQEAELKAIREAFPDYAAIHSHVLQDVLARLDKTYQAFFRRVANSEKAGFPRFHGKNRYHSFTYKEYGNGARLENGSLVLSKLGRIAVRWSRPIQGTIKTVTISKEADGWYVCCTCVEVPTEPLPLTGRETGIDVGIKVFLITAEGAVVANPRHYRTAERALKKAQQRVSRRKKGGGGVARRCRCSPSAISTYAGSGATSTTRRRSRSYVSTTRSTSRPFNPPISAVVPHPSRMRTATGATSITGPRGKPASTRAFTTLGGATSSGSSLSRQHAPPSEWKQ